MNTIEIDRLTKDYGRGRGVFDLTFSVAQGEAFGFLGPNGAGKTTTIRHLMGFSRPQSGSCRIGGLDCLTQSPKIQKDLGYIPGEIALPDEMTGLEFLRFLARYRGVSDFSRAEALMARFELDPRGRIRRMSKGMKQKVGIVCAFMHDPAVLVLDEPTSGLDPLMQNRFIELVLEEKARGKTILLSSHMFEEVERTCDRVGILRQGKLAAVEGVDRLKADRRCTYVVSFESEGEAAAFAADAPGVKGAEGRRVTVEVAGPFGPFTAALARHPVTGLEEVRLTLEELFLHYYGEGK
ncbi:ABC transporter ATP-binding protein [bacterium 210820-DFI.6.52]|uniref:ABC-2 type transport system ATP-binding protein n=1 Tax=Bittarella massiliensis (ex Durand et al. 2017) TaxID=1720313 RepID=A0AAQ1MC27_9FIRM|nr:MULTISPECIES: ABC transporter ATP-binding protein [Eubacteriales]MCB5940739.1 ABC transporter ATP-binding protein [bacterium 210820-DFI.6.52]ERI98908.1 ABC transporter, ATP-binding protein [Clostridium sp. ATCC 29733]MZL70069.1 ATP-binding cassette domain-containing protein [Bittarella massiliensis (ex Durand et al. 2017)]MZL81227.1 ATP-binding cassette domain-containing protein [Bittarella massiliensis (ex Durand et al. 2017)]SHF81519.1 ABC-2 type transport system ATP-binding protein [Bitt